jgi:Tfp pilus assembly protein PilE
VCPQCGFPIRRDAIPLQAPGGGPGAPPPGSRLPLVILAVVAGGFFVVVMIGVLAAIAIPRFSQAARQAREREGELLLKQAYGLEQTYRAENGRYASKAGDLRWDPPPTPLHYDLRVAAAGVRTLCLEAVPRPAAGEMPALSMDQDGGMYHEAGCGGAVELTGTGENSAAYGQDGGAGPGQGGTDDEEGARELMRQVYTAMLAYRARHGNAPRSVAAVLEQARDFRPGTQYQLGSAMRDGHICFIALPRGGRSSAMSYSLDPQGRMYEGPDCAGTLVGRFSSGRP